MLQSLSIRCKQRRWNQQRNKKNTRKYACDKDSKERRRSNKKKIPYFIGFLSSLVEPSKTVNNPIAYLINAIKKKTKLISNIVHGKFCLCSNLTINQNMVVLNTEKLWLPPIKKYYFVLCFKKNSLPLHSLSSLIVYESFWLDSLAQLVEHNTFNVGVMGSSPMRVTKR